MLKSLLLLALLLKLITQQMVNGINMIISQLMHRLRHQICSETRNLQHVVNHFRVQVARVRLRQRVIQFRQVDEIISREPFVSRNLLQRVASLGFNDQHVTYEMLALLRHEERNPKLAADDDASEIVKCCTIERQSAAHEHIQDDTQTPDVGARSVVLQSLEDFRRCVRRTSAECLEISSLRKCVAEAKVGELKKTHIDVLIARHATVSSLEVECYLDVHISIEQNIFSFQISMHDSVAMTIVDG